MHPNQITTQDGRFGARSSGHAPPFYAEYNTSARPTGAHSVHTAGVKPDAALTAALKQYIDHDDAGPLIRQLQLHADNPDVRALAEEHYLLHLITLRADKDLFYATLALSLNSNDVDQYGKTPLHLAQKNPCEHYTRALLNKGADPNRANRKNETPLHWAVQAEHYGHVLALLSHGAELLLEDGYFSEKPLLQNNNTTLLCKKNMQKFLLVISLLFQLEDIKTDGLEIVNELRAKQKLIAAITDELTPSDLQSCHSSITPPTQFYIKIIKAP